VVAVFGLVGVVCVLLVAAGSCTQISAFYKDMVRLWRTRDGKFKSSFHACSAEIVISHAQTLPALPVEKQNINWTSNVFFYHEVY
jgi:hypothetical protein